MARSRYSAVLGLLSLAAMLPGVAAGGTLWPPNCTVPSRIMLVGTDAANTPDPAGEFLVVARDRAGVVVPNCTVDVDFSSCADLHLCPSSGDLNVVCPNFVYKFTDATGSARLRVVGAADPSLEAQGAHGPCAVIRIDGYYLGTVPVSVLDLNGGGLSATDLARFAADYFSSEYWARSDYDGDGSVSAIDLSIWAGAFFGGESSHGCSVAPCP